MRQVQYSCQDHDLAEFAVCQALGTLFIVHARRPLGFTHEQQVKWWIVRAAQFVIKKELRKRRRQTTLDDLTEVEHQQSVSGQHRFQGSIPSIESRMTVRDIGRLLEQLPVEGREVLEGQLRDGAPFSTATERSRLLRARRRYRPCFVAEGLLPPPVAPRRDKRKRARK